MAWNWRKLQLLILILGMIKLTSTHAIVPLYSKSVSLEECYYLSKLKMSAECFQNKGEKFLAKWTCNNENKSLTWCLTSELFMAVTSEVMKRDEGQRCAPLYFGEFFSSVGNESMTLKLPSVCSTLYDQFV